MKYLVIVSGPQGSGKTTQAEMVAKKFDMALFEAGKQLRAYVAAKKPGSDDIESAMEKGVLVPHHYLNRLFVNFTEENSARAGLVSDGFPRSLEQWGTVQEVIESSGMKVIGVFVNLRQETALERIRKRTETLNGQVVHRADDTEEALKQRFATYHAETIPVLEFIREHHRLLEVDGSGSVEQVSEDIIEQLEPLLNGS
ncbi:MAG: nucleoside monophosphate kinase [Candidatus Berkelbacteria bacterium]|nr:MAG: nucleoside monophosphate kinase [Candidatus Berkelbacteria bacterium]QQG52113.1 MAG: nucleoside monophosphate kinase [Candidatus Berkelbacteria bacterium]